MQEWPEKPWHPSLGVHDEQIEVFYVGYKQHPAYRSFHSICENSISYSLYVKEKLTYQTLLLHAFCLIV